MPELVPLDPRLISLHGLDELSCVLGFNFLEFEEKQLGCNFFILRSCFDHVGLYIYIYTGHSSN